MSGTLVTADQVKGLSTKAFKDLWKVVEAEARRREAIAVAGVEMDHRIRQARSDLGLPERGVGEEWTQPVEFYDAYPQGALITHEGQKLVSDIHANLRPPTDTLAWVHAPENEAIIHAD